MRLDRFHELIINSIPYSIISKLIFKAAVNSLKTVKFTVPLLYGICLSPLFHNDTVEGETNVFRRIVTKYFKQF